MNEMYSGTLDGSLRVEVVGSFVVAYTKYLLLKVPLANAIAEANK